MNAIETASEKNIEDAFQIAEKSRPFPDRLPFPAESGLLLDAFCMAEQRHRGALRKGTVIPYIVHPVEAAGIVRGIMKDRGIEIGRVQEEVLAAALLHDVIEDAGVTAEEIEQKFGSRVRSLVEAESENKRRDIPAEDSWKIRKQETLDRLGSESLEVKMIAMGDKLSNMRDISVQYSREGDRMFEAFHQKDVHMHAWYYRGIRECLKDLSDTRAFREYSALCDQVFR